MTSYDGAFQPSSNFAPSSWSSSLGINDALASYQRSQYLAASRNVTSITPANDFDEESAIGPDMVQVREDTASDRAYMPIPGPRPSSLSTIRPQNHTNANERAPLLGQQPNSPRKTRIAPIQYTQTSPRPPTLPEAGTPPLTHQPSTESIEKHTKSTKSSFGQSLFNSISILVGFGMLSEPLAFAYAGWIGGSILIVFYGLITCYTAKILAKIMLEDPTIRTYADIGRKAFGPRSTFLTSTLFCFELFAVSVVLVTLFGDSLHSMIPEYSTTTYKVLSLVILIPTVFLPLSLLSFASIIGIISTLLIIAVVFVDGLTKSNGPGSLWSPAGTHFGLGTWSQLGLSFGLFMAGFSGHTVLPSLARDMENPREFDKMINWAFIAATIIYAAIGGCGYLMFGDSVTDELSRDLFMTPGYNVVFNKLAGWSLVVMPLTKYALASRPVSITLESIMGIGEAIVRSPSQEELSATLRPNKLGRSMRVFRSAAVAVERVSFTVLAVTVSILVPEFGSMMAFLGSFSAFTLCVIGPVSAKIAMTGRCGLKDASLLFTAVVMAGWGTIAVIQRGG